MPPPEQAPPQQGQQPTYEQIAAAIAAGAAASAAPTAAPGAAGAATGALSAAAVAQTTKTVIEKMLDLARTRWNVMFDPSGPVAETVKDEYPSRDTTDVMDLVDQREREFEREFRRKMRRRLEADIPEALAEPDPKKREQRLANIFKREMRYTAMREEAILSRAMGALEADMLQTLSPKGAYWKLSPHVKEHTLDCLAMGEKFWPWSVLRKVQPPLHYGCPCYLLGLDEVVEMGLMTAEQVPDEADARARYGRIAEKIDDLRDLDEAAIEELYAVALENLEEARVRRPLRWAKGLVKGGQFRPMRGGTPGRRVALPLPESPTKQRGAERGRWTWVGGAYTKIPEADAWTRNRNGKTYHSPPGGTNLYADGVLINEPGQVSPPGERVKAPVGTPAGIPAELAAKIDSARSMFRREAHSGRGIPPIAVGDGPSAVLNLRDAGYTADEATLVGPKQRGLRFKASEGTLLVELGSVGAVQNVRWEPARKNRQRETLTRPAETWDEHTGDALGFADELGEKYSTKVKAPTMFADDSLGDHAGTHLWTGEIKVGREAPVDVERAGLKRAAGEPLSEDEKRGVYATYWVTMHELTHSVNPIAPMDFNGPNASLEEAIAEEMGHKLALDRLAAHGQYDVIEWRFANPDALAVRGVYPNERYALQTILDEAKVPEADRAEVIQRMAFQMRPDARLSYLATLHAGENGGDVNESRARIETLLDEKTMRRAPTSFRSIINPKSVRPKTVGQYGTWSNEDGTPGDWTPDEDALNKWTAEIQVGPQVTLAGDGVPVVKYSDGTVGVGTPHGSSTDELTLTPNAAAAAQVALLRSDYAAVYATDYKATGRREKGDAELSPAQVASQRAMAALMDSPESPGITVDPGFVKAAKKTRRQWKNAGVSRVATFNERYRFGHVTAKEAKKIGGLINEASVAVRMNSRGLSSFLKDGVMLTSMDRGQRPTWRVELHKEKGKGKPDDYAKVRAAMEESLFGNAPVYGYFRSEEAGPMDASTFFYGDVIVELDPQVKDRTTWTIGDSINTNEPRTTEGKGRSFRPRAAGAVPTPVGESSPLAVAILGPGAPTDYDALRNIDDLFTRRKPVQRKWTNPDTGEVVKFDATEHVIPEYAEAQIHGSRPTVDEVRRVIFQAPDENTKVADYGPNSAQQKALDRAGVPWEIQNIDGKVLKRGKAKYEAPEQTDWQRTDAATFTGPVSTPPKIGSKVKPELVAGAPIGSRITFEPMDGDKPIEVERRNYGWFLADDKTDYDFQDAAEELLRVRLLMRDGEWDERFDKQRGYRPYSSDEIARAVARPDKEWQQRVVVATTQDDEFVSAKRGSGKWSALPPMSPGTLPDPPQSPGWGWFGGEKEEKSAWLPKKGAKKPKPAKPKPPKVIGGKKNVPEDNGTPFPDYDGQKLTISGRAGGSNGAQWALDENGDRWLVKTYRGDEDRIATELVANRIYALMGATVARAGMIEVDGKTGLTYKALDGKPRDRVFHKEGPNAKMGEHYMTDALLANWDFAGLTDDNVLWGEDGNPIRVDQGGTLEFRAMGQQKPFGPVPTDVWTMLRKGQGKRASLVTEDQMREQAAAIAETLTPEVIDELMNTAPFVDAEMRERVRENLKARVDWMGAFADGDVNIPQIPEGASARDEFTATQDGFELYPEEISALSFYSLGGAQPVQAHLRSKAPDEGADPKVLGAVDALDAILKDAKTREDLFVYVPMDKSVGDDAKLVGRTVEERGFIHATTDRSVAAEDGAMLRLLVPAGSHAVRLRGLDPTLPDGPEVVIRRDSRMKITSVRDDDGAEVWEATLLPPARRGFGFSGPYKPSGGASKGKKPSPGQMGLLDVPEDFPEPPMSPGTIVASVNVDGEDRAIHYVEVTGLPTSTRVFAAFAEGEEPEGDDRFELSILPAAPVAFLTVDSKKNTVELAYTDEKYRRMGLADSLLEVARQDTGNDLKMDTGERSPMGEEWAAAAGITASPEGGALNRPLRQSEANEMGTRMLDDIREAYVQSKMFSDPSDFREILPEPPMSPGTAPGRAAALTMPDEEARALLAENGMNAAKPDPKKAVREADPAFLGTLAYLSTLYPQAADYVSEVAFASSKTLGESPVEGGPRSGKVSGQIRRSARAANWGAQVRWTTDWNDPNGDFDSNFRGKLIYNDYRGDDADYLRQMNDGAIITLPRTDGSKLRLQHYRWESGLAEAIGIPAEGWVEEGQTPQAARRVPYGIRTSQEVQDIWRTENAHTISDTYPDATPNNEAAQAAHEFGHAIAGGLRSPEFTALLTEANDNLKENPRTADAIPLAAYVDKYLASASEAGTDAPLAWLWTLTDRIARQTKTGDLGWRVFIDRGISMGEIRSVSPYAATEPAEALAELFSAHYLGLLDDELDAKFEAMLADLTQTDLPEPPMSPGTMPEVEIEDGPNGGVLTALAPDGSKAGILAYGIVGGERRWDDAADDLGEVPENAYIEVEWLEVPEKYQRQGIATALSDKLTDLFPDVPINHGDRSEDAEAWAAATGTAQWTLGGKPLPEPPMSPGTEPLPDAFTEATQTANVKVEKPVVGRPFLIPSGVAGLAGLQVAQSAFGTQPEEANAYYEALAPAIVAMNEDYPEVMGSLSALSFLSNPDVGWTEDWAKVAMERFPDATREELRDAASEAMRSNLAQARASFTYGEVWGDEVKIIFNDLTVDNSVDAGAAQLHLAPATKTPYGTWLHEFGHAVAHHYGIGEKLSLQGAYKFADDDDFDWQQHYDNGGDLLGWDFLAEYFNIMDVMDVSPYASVNANEAFAEMFAMYHHPDFDLPPELKEAFERFLAEMRARNF